MTRALAVLRGFQPRTQDDERSSSSCVSAPQRGTVEAGRVGAHTLTPTGAMCDPPDGPAPGGRHHRRVRNDLYARLLGEAPLEEPVSASERRVARVAERVLHVDMRPVIEEVSDVMLFDAEDLVRPDVLGA